MQVEIPGLYFALLALSMAFINLPLFSRLDATPATSLRYGTLDGLRGFLALSVFVFHLIVTREFLATDVWQPPHSRVYRLLGPLGVSLFFMITGFHGMHVSAGVIYLLIVAFRVRGGFYERRGGNYEIVEIAGLYWHFVDLVWVFIFAFFYLW